MKRKVILSLLALFLFSAAGSITANFYIRHTTQTLSRLIKLHQVEDFRKDLIISIQIVQSELYTVGTVLAHSPDVMLDNIMRLKQAADACGKCHDSHPPDVTTRIGLLQTDIQQYKESVNSYMAASGKQPNIHRLKLEAAEIGSRLQSRTQKMSLDAGEKLAMTTAAAMTKIDRVQTILTVTLAVTFVAGILIAGKLIRSITRPINALVTATRALASGDFTHTIRFRDNTEFGELAGHFNAMSAALKGGYAKLEQEIIERKQTEAALAKSEGFLNTIFDSIRDPFCIIDRNFRIVRANEAYAAMKNVLLTDLIGATCYRKLHGREEICEDCIIRRTFLSGDGRSIDRNTAAPGEMKIWYEVYTYPIVDNTGSISHVVEYTRDITERKQAEKALRESEERYALAAQGANDGLWDWDLRSNRIHYSHRWKSMLGYGENDFGNDPEEWFSRVHPDDRDELRAKIGAHLDGRSSHFESEYRIMHRDGTYRWALSRGVAVRGASMHLSRMAGSQTDITLRKNAEERLVYDAFHDALTGIPNRALFMDRLQHVIDGARRHNTLFYAVLFLDMDRFKIINDSLGHSVGDMVLVEVGRKLMQSLRPGDTVARIGGDEFAILLDGITAQKDAVEIAERIHEKLSVPLLLKGNEVFTSTSIGIAFGADGYERPEQILRDADIAMYQAKMQGSARYEIFDSRMHANILDRLTLEADLRRAIDRREFTAHYQPILELKNNRLVGFEALIRWKHPKRGLIYPREFIPVAEENGMIIPIGEWILRESCQQLASWQRQYGLNPPLTMSINVSGKQFSQPDLVEKLQAAARETGVDPDTLALEITESMIMENIEKAITTMVRLRNIGFHIHIDDFGTGYSSLSYLHRFPVTALKIDRIFINKLGMKGENREIINSIVSLANSLNLKVIAEGVERSDQLSGIKDLNCPYGQGHFFSIPMESGEIAEWIKKNGMT